MKLFPLIMIALTLCADIESKNLNCPTNKTLSVDRCQTPMLAVNCNITEMCKSLLRMFYIPRIGRSVNNVKRSFLKKSARCVMNVTVGLGRVCSLQSDWISEGLRPNSTFTIHIMR